MLLTFSIIFSEYKLKQSFKLKQNLFPLHASLPPSLLSFSPQRTMYFTFILVNLCLIPLEIQLQENKFV